MTVADAHPPAASAHLAPPGTGTGQIDLTVTRRHGAATFHGIGVPAVDAALDLLVETVCDLLEVDYAGVHLLDAETHRVLACSTGDVLAPVPRSDSLCGVLLDRHVGVVGADARPFEIVEIPDTAADPTLPPAAAAGYAAPVRFYAAAPLCDAGGLVLGTLCAIAHHPRSLTATERRTLLFLGLAATRLLQPR